MLSQPAGWPLLPGVLLELYDVEPRVDIQRTGRRYQVSVVDQRTRLGGEFGWKTTAVTNWGAKWKADRIVRGIKASRAKERADGPR